MSINHATALRDVRLTGGRDEAATASWTAARNRTPHHGANRISATSGWNIWIDCHHCGSAYAFRPFTGGPGLDHSVYARWVTACTSCGQDVVLWSGARWNSGQDSLAAAS